MKFFSGFLHNNLILKLAGMNGVTMLVRLVCGVLYNMLLSRIVGPTGLAFLGNLRNLLQSIQVLGTLGMENGVIRYTAEDSEQSGRHLSTAWFLTLASSLVIAIGCFLLAPFIAHQLLEGTSDEMMALRFLSAVLPLYTFIIFLYALLKGSQAYNVFIGISIVVAITAFLVGAVLVWQLGYIGAIYALVATPLVQCLVAFFAVRKGHLGNFSFIRLHFDRAAVPQLLKYSIMALFSAVLVPVSLIYVRSLVISQEGQAEAGLYEGMLRISGYYSMFVLSLMGLYILPEFSKSDKPSNLRRVLKQFFKSILPIFFIGLLALYLLRDVVVSILFGDRFDGVQDLFAWQLAGDVFKTVSSALALWFIARNNLQRYLLTEVISVTVFSASAYYLISRWGTQGAVMAHFICYVVYTVSVTAVLFRELTGKPSK